MPTPNEFNDFRFSPQQDDYKQTAMEQKDRDFQMMNDVTGLPGPSNGNYPRIFDREAGSEPVSPDLYIDKVFSDVRMSGAPKSGEYGQVTGQTLGNFVGTDMVPSPSPSKQFSSDKSGNPIELLNQTKANVEYHANLNEAYGLTQPIAGLGIHPWLRDGLAGDSEDEPGNAQPKPGIRVPFGGK